MSLSNFPLISVIIPFYNHNHFIKKTLDSILEDTYSNKEIIIINDGSSNPDDSNIINWIEQHKDDVSVQYIKRENRGLTKTLNELIRLSNGKYIVVCASDDYLINNTIKQRVNVLETTPDTLVLISDNIVVDNDGNQLYDSNLFSYRTGIKQNYLDRNRLKKTIIKNWGLAGPCFIANKKVYTILGNYDETLMVEDWDFFLRAVAHNYISFFDEKVSAYRLHNNTFSDTSKKTKMLQDLAHTAKKNIKEFQSPYFKYLLLKQYKFIRKHIKMAEKNFVSLSKEFTFKKNIRTLNQNYKNGAISVYDYFSSFGKISRYAIRRFFKAYK